MSNNVLVFIEQRAGKILPASFQLFTPATTLAQTLGGQVDACIVAGGRPLNGRRHGASHAIRVDSGAAS